MNVKTKKLLSKFFIFFLFIFILYLMKSKMIDNNTYINTSSSVMVEAPPVEIPILETTVIDTPIYYRLYDSYEPIYIAPRYYDRPHSLHRQPVYTRQFSHPPVRRMNRMNVHHSGSGPIYGRGSMRGPGHGHGRGPGHRPRGGN